MSVLLLAALLALPAGPASAQPSFIVPFSLDAGGLSGGGLSVNATTTAVTVLGVRQSETSWGLGPANFVAGATVWLRAGPSGTLSVDLAGLGPGQTFGAGSGYKAFVQFANDPQNFVAVGLIHDPLACPLCGSSGVTLMVEGISSLVSSGPIGGYWSNLVVPPGTHRLTFAWNTRTLSITLDSPTGYINTQPLVFPIVMTQPSISFMGAARRPGDAVTAGFQNITFNPPLPLPFDLTGTYQGTEVFASGELVGLRVAVTQFGSTFGGTYSNAAGDAGTMSGTIAGTTFNGSAVSTVLPVTCDFAGTFSIDGATITATLTCSNGDSGSFTLSRF